MPDSANGMWRRSDEVVLRTTENETPFSLFLSRSLPLHPSSNDLPTSETRMNNMTVADIHPPEAKEPGPAFVHDVRQARLVSSWLLYHE